MPDWGGSTKKILRCIWNRFLKYRTEKREKKQARRIKHEDFEKLIKLQKKKRELEKLNE